MADGHRELARQLFASLPAEAFDCLDDGPGRVIGRLRAQLSESTYVDTSV